ncbi:F-box protein [Rhizoctonia solani AG-3 Rhs1AP]|uniref:F-box protein n=2 Tax=Rhizoctonia solani AG-3 TaxID=1086053 RepID=X8JCH1_9AGAM|nr:F-box protein [Rhizoctonia solani AG-3 Rhs1AP]
MASRRRAATHRLTRLPDKGTSQVFRNWRKKIRLISPNPECSSPMISNHGFQGFMSLPVDVFVNIASYFQPQDVLALSRVNSFLRRLLRSRESEPIWRSARLNFLGLPPCPKELSEPKYAGLLFSKICTLCNRRALQSMDPMLLERLCRKCKDIELVDLAEHEVDASLVFASTTILPGYCEDWSERGPWCFYDDIQIVKSKLYEFDIAGNEEGKQSWIKRRREIVIAREESSEPLKEWFHQLEMNREAELDRRRVAREVEINARLKQLGYDERDMGFQQSSAWVSLVRNAGPLTDKVWKGLLPKLVKIIKANCRERIRTKRENRRTEIMDWAWPACEAKIFRLWQEEDSDSSDSYILDDDDSDAYFKRGPNLNATTILLNELETRPEVQPEVKLLLDGDMSDDEFERRFTSQQHKLAILLTTWVDEQEARLVSMMPSDISAPDFDYPNLESPMTFVTNEDSTPLPMDALPDNTQKLLRADAVFVRAPADLNQHTSTSKHMCYLYPNFDGLPDRFTYSNIASEIAASLLACLGRPNASYLEMTAVGYALECGMCPEIGPLDWKNLIEHCLEEHWVNESSDSEGSCSTLN